MLKPLFNIERIHVDGSRLFYEVYYRQGKSYTKIVDACFMNLKAANDYIDSLVSEV